MVCDMVESLGLQTGLGGVQRGAENNSRSPLAINGASVGSFGLLCDHVPVVLLGAFS